MKRTWRRNLVKQPILQLKGQGRTPKLYASGGFVCCTGMAQPLTFEEAAELLRSGVAVTNDAQLERTILEGGK